MKGESAALDVRPPAGAGSGLFNETYSTAIPFPGSSAATLVLPVGGQNGIPYKGCYIRFVADQDCFIRFGSSSALVGSATSSDFLLGQGVTVDWWCDDTDNAWFAVIAKTTAGLLKRYRTNL